jgi:DNA-directed RNA polymerase subunit RPC12/RpoP
MSWFSNTEASIVTAAIYARTECPECGSSLTIPGLRSELYCKACKSRIPVPKELWSGIFFRLHSVFPSKSAVSLALAGALTSELPIYARFAAEHPSCIQCRSPLRLDLRPLGTEGPTPCSGCALTTPSYPTPPWLRAEYPDLQQFFEPVPPPVPAAQTRTVSYPCPECGANSKLTENTPRLFDCQYCQHTLFLPPELWFAMHPVQRRTPWWVAFVR